MTKAQVKNGQVNVDGNSLEFSDLASEETWGAGLPHGWNNVTCEEASMVEADTGTPQIELLLSNDQGRIKDWQVVTGKSLGKIKQILEAFGVDIPEGKFVLDVSELVGREAEIKVGTKQAPGSNQVYDSVVAYR